MLVDPGNLEEISNLILYLIGRDKLFLLNYIVPVQEIELTITTSYFFHPNQNDKGTMTQLVTENLTKFTKQQFKRLGYFVLWDKLE